MCSLYISTWEGKLRKCPAQDEFESHAADDRGRWSQYQNLYMRRRIHSYIYKTEDASPSIRICIIVFFFCHAADRGRWSQYQNLYDCVYIYVYVYRIIYMHVYILSQ